MWYYPGSFGLALLQGQAYMQQAGSSGALIWILLGIVIGVLLSLALRKSKGQPERGQQAQSQPPQLNTQPPFQAPARTAASHARRCPVCNSTYTDEALIYCVSDGASLVPVINNPPPQDPQATLLYREAGNRDVPPTVPSRPDENQR
jgi:predicted lipid-binding transport protein (Tim44 family)